MIGPAGSRGSRPALGVKRLAYGRNEDGTYFDAQAEKPPAQVVIVYESVVSFVGVSVNVHSGLAPVPWETPVMTPVLATEILAMYLVAVVEHPDAAVSAGKLAECVDTYSDTDVLHAAIAASVSDIFDRMT